MSTAFTEIDLAIADGVATITLDRPDALNAITPTMLAGARELALACDLMLVASDTADRLADFR